MRHAKIDIVHQDIRLVICSFLKYTALNLQNQIRGKERMIFADRPLIAKKKKYCATI